MNTLKAYNNDPKLKSALLAEVAKHRAQDMLVKRTYGETDSKGKWRGCAVGCSLHSLNLILGKTYNTADHEAYPVAVGVPEGLAYLQDSLFERLNDRDAQAWPERFWAAIPVGADLRFVYGKWFAWTLLDEEVGFWKVWKNKEDQDVFKSYGAFVAFLAENKPFKKAEWDDVRLPFTKSLARLARLDRLDSAALSKISTRDLYKVAADKLITLLEEAK